jgi:hypothetical protein
VRRTVVSAFKDLVYAFGKTAASPAPLVEPRVAEKLQSTIPEGDHQATLWIPPAKHSELSIDRETGKNSLFLKATHPTNEAIGTPSQKKSTAKSPVSQA